MDEFTHHFGDHRSQSERHYETTWAHMPRQKPRGPSIITQIAGWFVAFLIAGTVLAWLNIAVSKAVGQTAFDAIGMEVSYDQ